MSIKLTPGACRLTVLGSGYSNSSVESGDGLTEDGKLWQDIAGDLGYDFGADVDWDQIAGDVDWSEDVVYIADDGSISADGTGTAAMPEDTLLSISEGLESTAQADTKYLQYTLPKKFMLSISNKKVRQETSWVSSDSGRPHKFSPSVYWIQWSENNAILFLSEPFKHSDANGENIEVSREMITIRDGSNKNVYWSSCATQFSTALFPDDYKHIPPQYVAWQWMWGTFDTVLVSEGEETINTQTLKEQLAADNDVIEVVGGARYERTVIDGKTYYKLIR